MPPLPPSLLFPLQVAHAALRGLPQQRLVDGSFWVSPAGPYRSVAELWDDEA